MTPTQVYLMVNAGALADLSGWLAYPCDLIFGGEYPLVALSPTGNSPATHLGGASWISTDQDAWFTAAPAAPPTVTFSLTAASFDAWIAASGLQRVVGSENTRAQRVHVRARLRTLAKPQIALRALRRWGLTIGTTQTRNAMIAEILDAVFPL